MAAIRHLLTGFFAGELSPFLFGRVETEQYRYGLSTCENWIPTIEGPLEKRPGFAMICAAGDTASWLTAFRRSIDQEYVIEWGEEVARFFTNGGRIETSPGVAYEVTTPYAAADAPQLSLQQSFDRLYLAHGSYPPGALRRDSAVTFAHEQLHLLDGPFADPNSDKAVTLTASGATGSVTLTASSALFDAGHVGIPVRLEAADFGTVPAWESGMKDVVTGDKVHNEGKVYQAASSGITGQVQPTHSEGTYYDGQQQKDELNDKGPYGVRWTYLHDRFGLLQVTAVASGTSVTATVTRRLPDSVVGTGTWRWSLGAFSAADGWPHLVTLWKGRMIALKDLDVHGSVVGDYGGGRVNFASHSELGTVEADLAFRRRLSIENVPLWVAKDRKLIIGTADRELAIGPINAAQALSGSNIEADDQSFYGSERVAPVQAGTETIFVERGGSRLRAADFDFARDRYDAADLTTAARHVTGPGVVQLAYQRNPRAMVHAVRSDGQVAIHPKSRAEIKGFARTVLGGGARCISAVSIVGADGRTEELWALIERENGADETVREIWKQEPLRQLGDAQDQAFFVDGGVRIAATAGQTSFAGLDHLAGQDVAVLANGGVVPGCTVDEDGVLTLPATSVPGAASFTVIVGLSYAAVAVGLSPEVSVNGQSAQGRKQTIKRMVLRLLETVGIRIGTSGGDLAELIDRPGNAPMDAPIPLFTGDVGTEVEAEFDRLGTPRWVSDAPLPAIVSAAMLNMEVDMRDV